MPSARIASRCARVVTRGSTSTEPSNPSARSGNRAAMPFNNIDSTSGGMNVGVPPPR